MTEETWKAVTGFEGLYEVSSLGRVRSARRRGTFDRIVRPDVLSDGYLRVALWRGNARTWKRLNRLVLETFIGPPPAPDYHAAHEPDPDITNCRIANLEWRTATENRAEQTARHRTPVDHLMESEWAAGATLVEVG